MKKIKFAGIMVALFFVASFAAGPAWTTKRLTNTATETYDPAIAADGAYVYVVWDDSQSGNSEIYFRKSADSGATWGAAKRLTYTTSKSLVPTVAADGAIVYVAWHDSAPGHDEIFFRKSLDGGATWQSAKRITNNAAGSVCPKLAVDGSKVYLVWYGSATGNIEIYFAKSLDGGATWKAAKRLTDNEGKSYVPDIAVAGANIYVVWYDDTPGNNEIYFKRSTDGGETWEGAKRLTSNPGASQAPAIAANGSKVYVVWLDDTTGNKEIYLRKSADGGATWKTPKKLTNNVADSEDPAIAVIGEQVYLTFDDYTPGNWDIYFKQSVDGGTSWTASQNLTNTAGGSAWPRIAATAANIFIVYCDETPGNGETYVKVSL